MMRNCLEFCPNLKKIYVDERSFFFEENKKFLTKLENIHQYLRIDSSNLIKMKIVVDKFSRKLKYLTIYIYGLTAEELKTCIECIARFENLKELKLTFSSLKTKQPIDDCLSLIGQKCNKIVKLDLDFYESVPISNRFFNVFTHFKTVKKLHISIFDKTVLSGSVECFKHCKQLNELYICCNCLTEQYFHNIESFIPKLQSLVIETEQIFSQSFIDSFDSMKCMKYSIIHNNSQFNTYYYFGKSLIEVI